MRSIAERGGRFSTQTPSRRSTAGEDSSRDVNIQNVHTKKMANLTTGVMVVLTKMGASRVTSMIYQRKICGGGSTLRQER
jgi:hypothetical protein